MEKKPMFTALHAGLSVYSMEESLTWYEKNMNFHLKRDDGFCPPLDAIVCFLEGEDGFILELFEYKEPKKLPQDRLEPNTDLMTVGTKHIAFQVRNMSEVKGRFLSNKVDIVFEAAMGREKVMFVRDCNGILVELMEF